MDFKTQKDKKKRESSEMKFDLQQPLLRVWYPKGSNKYGHVSIQTNKYYMSFWPKERTNKKEEYSNFWPTKTRDFKRRTDEKISEKSFIIQAGFFSVDASIIFHPNYDCLLEGGRFPDKREWINGCTFRALDKLYEKFLDYNGIDPSSVTLERAEEIREYNESVQEGNEIIPAVKDLGQTKYSFLPQLFYKCERPFYYDAQSCVSFVYHMTEWTYPHTWKKITLEFFGELFKLLDSVSLLEPPKREVYVNVLMHTVDGRIVSGTEIMLENQLTGKLENYNHKRRRTVQTPPLTLSYTVPKVIERENETNLGIGNIWEVPNFFSFFENFNIFRQDERVRYAYA